MKHGATAYGLRLIVLFGFGLVALGSALPAGAQTPIHVFVSEMLWGVPGQAVRVDYVAVDSEISLTSRQEQICRHEAQLEIVDADSLQILASNDPVELLFGSLSLPYAIQQEDNMLLPAVQKVLARISIRLLPASNAEAGEIAAICRKRALFSLVDADGSLVFMVPISFIHLLQLMRVRAG